jgi:hypothetical protein
VWSDIVQQALRLCDAVLLDLRSGGLFVRAEFLEVLRNDAVDRTVAIVRDDGRSCIDSLIDDRPEIMNAFRSTLKSDEFRRAIQSGWTPLQCEARPAGMTRVSAELAATLATRLERRTAILADLSRRIVAASRPDADLDRDIVMTLDSLPTDKPSPSVTSSFDEAAALIHRVSPDAQYSLHITDESGHLGAGIGKEGILGSFRTVMSWRTDHVTSGLALMDALVQSELGHGIGTGPLVHVLVRFAFPDEPEPDRDGAIELRALLDRVRAEAPDSELDADLIDACARGCHNKPTTKLEDALSLIQCSSPGWRAAVYVDPTDGTAFAEVYAAYGAGYKVAISSDEDGTARMLPPPRAVLSAWLKARLGSWDFYGQAGGSMEWCVGTPGERTLLSEGDRQTLRTRGHQIGRLR